MKNRRSIRDATRIFGRLSRAARLAVAAVLMAVQGGLVPVFLALAVLMDGGHRPDLRFGSSGVEVVLRHDHDGSKTGVARPCANVHTCLATILVGQASAANHPDHVIQAAGASVAAETPQDRSIRHAHPPMPALSVNLFDGTIGNGLSQLRALENRRSSGIAARMRPAEETDASSPVLRL